MTKLIIKLRVYWIWQTSKEIKWLELMAAQGFELVYAIPFFYFFKKAEPEKVYYCHDYVSVKKSERENYLQLFEDAGWQFVMRYGNWFYFKSKNEDKVYSDKHSETLRTLSILKGIININVFALITAMITFAIGDALNVDIVLGFGSGLASFSAVVIILSYGILLWQNSKLDFNS